MKITSLNLQGFENWEERSPKIVEYLRAEDPDVILFQEVVYLPNTESPYNQVQLLNKQLRYPVMHNAVSRLQVGLTTPVYREGLGFLSKYPALETEVLVLKQHKGGDGKPADEHQRIVQFMDLAVGEGVMKLANVHYSLTDTYDYASPQLEETLEIIKPRDEQRIVIGDLNIGLEDMQEAKHMWEGQYTATTDGFDYTSYPDFHGVAVRRTYALTPPVYKVSELTVSPEDLSDHQAVTFVINHA